MSVNRLALVALAAVFGLMPPAAASGGPRPAPEPQAGRTIAFSVDGATFYGPWHADVTVANTDWAPGSRLDVDVTFRFMSTHLARLRGLGIAADKWCLLLTAERAFDSTGWMRLPSDERMSTLQTPTGIAIEGGVQGPVTTRYGYPFRTPVDEFVSVAESAAQPSTVEGMQFVTFPVHTTLPANLPPGLYRLRLDFGVMAGTKVYNPNGLSFSARPFSDQAGTNWYIYSPVIEASGADAQGRHVDASRIQPRFPWLLLATYNSNGYKGVVADEDAHRFATADHNLIADDVILPMYSDGGSRLTYSLEPQFPADSIDAAQNLAWNYASGALTVRITDPSGAVTDLGTASFMAKSGNGATTKAAAFTSWKPPLYGWYTVTATGWVLDQAGRRYEGGGTYRFWIAKRMTLATATFQGQPYLVGSTYGRDIQFNPAVPADVQVTASLFVDSDPQRVATLTYAGRATNAGLFGAAQGMRPFPLAAAGEYHAKILATYADPEGHLWVSTMRHAGIVYPGNSPVEAHGKKLSISGKYVERGNTLVEGWTEANGTTHLQHLTFPYLAGDVLLIASEGQSSNKIEPVLTYRLPGDTTAWDSKLTGVGVTNLRIKTSNGYSPHLFPEFITDIEYFYGAAPRPGFMGRFLVGESNLRAPYWSLSPNSFGGQIGASVNGDAPGDIYRLIGGVALRRVGEAPMYAGYIASAFVLPAHSNNNRVVEAGAEDLNGPLGTTARFFLVGLRPGTSYEVGATFRPALQIDPLLPVSIHFVLTYPDGRQQVADGVGDRFGSFAGPAAWPLDIPGVYRYQISASWNGYAGSMPGLPADGGKFFVFSKTRPAGTNGLKVDGTTQRTFSASTGTTITGSSTASVVHFTLITPGAVIDQGELPVVNGKFSYRFDPAAVHARVPLYDIVNNSTGSPQIGRVIHLTFFAEESSPSGTFHDVTRVILRGTTLLSAREPLPTAPTYLLSLNRTGNGTVTLATTGGGVECATCAEPYAAGTLVTLTAAAAPGSIFVGWSGACSGMGPCTLTMDAARSVNAAFQSAPIHRRYFAEGAVTGLFDCRFALVNAQETTAHVTMRFLKDGGANASYQLEVPPLSRRTVDARQVPGLAPAFGFGTIVESDVPVVADRTMSWDATGYGGHSETGVEAPAQTWYLTEGSTFVSLQVYYVLANPNDRPTTVQVSYLRSSGGAPIVKTYAVAAASRRTIWVNGEDPALAAASFSGVVTSLDPAAPIVVERAMYLNAGGQFFGAGHAAAGVTAAATEWVFAEGATGPFFDFYLVIANPGASPSEIDVTYLLTGGGAVVRHYQVAPYSRRTIYVNDEPGLEQASISTRIQSTNGVPVTAERAMWWPRPGAGNWIEGHASAGATTAGTVWVVADGEQGGTRNTDTYLLIANTASSPGRARVTLLFEDGSSAVREVEVAANSRTTVWTGGTENTPSSLFGGMTSGRRFGAVIESLPVNGQAAGLVVERAMYWDANGVWWAAGTSALGTKVR